MKFSKKLGAIAVSMAVLSAAGIAGATASDWVLTRGGGPAPGVVKCPGGMTRLGHPFDQDMSIFPFDPAVTVEDVYTVEEDFFKVEQLHSGAHAGTHLDVPAHFIEDGRTLDQLSAEEFVWPAYKLDVRGMSFENNFVEVADIRAYERENGRIKPGSLVILQTGAEEFFGLHGGGDHFVAGPEENGVLLSNNTDDLFDFENAGFSGAAVQWLFDKRNIDGVGSDAYGPDAAGDDLFDATFTTLANDGVALVAIANLDTVSVRGDVIMAPTVSLTDGSGFSTDPIACHAEKPDADDDDEDDSRR